MPLRLSSRPMPPPPTITSIPRFAVSTASSEAVISSCIEAGRQARIPGQARSDRTAARNSTDLSDPVAGPVGLPSRCP